MYLEHFGLSRPPFKITPDTSMFYSGNKRRAALEALKYAIASGEGIIKVVGEVGAGKTMLCRMLELELGQNIEVVYIANPSLSPENILHVIAFELQLKINSASSKLEVMQALQSYLLEKHASNKQVVVFVEEAQSMPLDTLEEIRLLSNLETNESKLLQMVLFGQPELDEKLRQPSIRQLKERITHNFYLQPFAAEDVYQYLNFRLRAAGYTGPDLFSPKIAHRIKRRSNGLTRRINILADKSLLAAYSEGRHDILAKHIKLAAKDSDFHQNMTWHNPLKILTGIAIVLLSLWIGSMLPGLIKTDSYAIKGIQAEPKKHLLNTQSNQITKPLKHFTAKNTPAELDSQANTKPVFSANNFLNKKLKETQQWISNASNDSFTIQLILLDGWAKNDAVKFIQYNSRYLELDKIYIYKASIRGRSVYSVLYNEYTQRRQAVAQLKKLPEKLIKNAPYLRTLKGIKYDIRKSLAIGNP